MLRSQLARLESEQLLNHVSMTHEPLFPSLLRKLSTEQLLEYSTLLSCELPRSQLSRMSGQQLLSYVSLRMVELVPSLQAKLTTDELLEYQTLTGLFSARPRSHLA
jgi:hypothetical protein